MLFRYNKSKIKWLFKLFTLLLRLAFPALTCQVLQSCINCLVFQEHIGVANHHYSWAIKSQKVTELNSSLFISYDDKEQRDCQLNRLLESGKRAHKMALP